MERLLPQKTAYLQKWVDSLPDNEISPVAPFGSVVANINVSTTCHRDPMDLDLCSVLTISDCKGGGIALKEAGVSIETRNGDAVLFPSGRITHFNRHFKGKRGSMVFHTDKMALKWIKDRNGWEEHRSFASSDSRACR
jgi:hypothetical protein